MYVTVDELREMVGGLMGGRETNDTQVSMRLPETLVKLAKATHGEANYQEALRYWMWVGAVAGGVMEGDGLRGRFVVNVHQDPNDRKTRKESVTLQIYDRAKVLRQAPPGWRIPARVEVWFNVGQMARDPNFPYRVSELAVAAQNVSVQEWGRELAAAKSDLGVVYARVWVNTKPWPSFVRAQGESRKELDDVLTRVASSADKLFAAVYERGRTVKMPVDFGLMRDDALIESLPAIAESFAAAEEELKRERDKDRGKPKRNIIV